MRRVPGGRGLRALGFRKDKQQEQGQGQGQGQEQQRERRRKTESKDRATEWLVVLVKHVEDCKSP